VGLAVKSVCCCNEGEGMCLACIRGDHEECRSEAEAKRRLACIRGDHEECRSEAEAKRRSQLSPVELRLERLEATVLEIATSLCHLTDQLVRESQVGRRP
jgi:hypothetical protein